MSNKEINNTGLVNQRIKVDKLSSYRSKQGQKSYKNGPNDRTKNYKDSDSFNNDNLSNKQNNFPIKEYNGESLFDINEYPALDDLEATSRARLIKQEQSKNFLTQLNTTTQQQPQQQQQSIIVSNSSDKRTNKFYQNNNVNIKHNNEISSSNVRTTNYNSQTKFNKKIINKRNHNKNDNIEQKTDNEIYPPQLSPMLFWNNNLVISPPSMSNLERMPGDKDEDRLDSFLFNYNVTNSSTPRVHRIKSQIEFYFSSYNLKNDIFLRNNMDINGYVQYNIIRQFPRIQNLKATLEDVRQACNQSIQLEILDDPVRIRRKKNPELWTNSGLFNEIMRIFYSYMKDEHFNEWYLYAEDYLFDCAMNQNMKYVHPSLISSPYYNHLVYSRVSASSQLLNISRFLAPGAPPYYCYLINNNISPNDNNTIENNNIEPNLSTNGDPNSNAAFMTMITNITNDSNYTEQMIKGIENINISNKKDSNYMKTKNNQDIQVTDRGPNSSKIMNDSTKIINESNHINSTFK